MSARQVTLDGGSPWGFRIHGGYDVGLPLKISRVNPGSKAAQKGIREGDVISSINGHSTRSLDNSEAHALLKNAGQHLHLSLNEDGPVSPRRRSKQTVITTVTTERTASARPGVSSKKVEITTEEKKETIKEGSNLVKAEPTLKENDIDIAYDCNSFLVSYDCSLKIELFDCSTMPKKSKNFRFLGSKPKEKPVSENRNSPDASRSVGEDETPQTSSPVKERYFSFLQVPVESKDKTNAKKQKRKGRKNKLETEKMEMNNKKLVEICVTPVVRWDTTEDLENFEECVANVGEDAPEDNALKISEVNVLYGADRDLSDSSPAMNEDEEESLREFLRTLEIVDTRIREQNENAEKSMTQLRKSDSDYEIIEFSRGIKTVEPIAEEIFEVVTEEDGLKQKEAICKGSPSLSPRSRRNRVKISKFKEEPPPKILYSYNGIPFADENRKQAIVVQDIDDGILVINNIRCKERDRYPFRQLDVILEESSDFSDSSSVNSDKKNDSGLVYKTLLDRTERIFDGRGKTFDLQIQPVIKETVKIFPLYQSPTNGIKTDSTQVRIQTVVLEKVHPTSIVKIELPEKDSDNDEENELPGVEDGEEIASFSDRTYENLPLLPCHRSNLSPFHLNDSAEIQFIDEDSEKSWSSGINVEDGGDADVESELDSRRDTLLLSGGDNDLSISLEDIIEQDDSTDYGTIKKSPYLDKMMAPEESLETGADKDENKSEARPSEKMLKIIQANLCEMKSSPTFSGRDSASSFASGATVRNLSCLEQSQEPKDESPSMGDQVDLCSSPPGIVDAETFDIESPYRDSKILLQMEKIRKDVNVKKLAKTMEKDLDKILKSKLKVIEFFEEPILSEASWSNILQSSKTKATRESLVEEEDDADSVGVKSNFSLVKFKHHSNSSSYENVSKSRESVCEYENIYETVLSPEALSDLAEKKVMSLPYGHFLLKKIGLGKCCKDTKDSEDDIYTKIEAKVQNSARRQPLTRSHSTSSSDKKSRCLPCGNSTSKKTQNSRHPSYIEFNLSSPPNGQEAEIWYGMPTSHPALLLGLSPSQKKVYEQKHERFLSSEEEAANLLDLHKKFLERRSYNEWNPFRRDRTVVFDSSDVVYSEIVPKKRTEAETHKRNDAVRETRDEVVGEKSVRRTDCAKPDKEREKTNDIGSCGLLAVLQNAAADDSVPKLTNCSSSSLKLESTQKGSPYSQKRKIFRFESGSQNSKTSESVIKGTGNSGSVVALTSLSSASSAGVEVKGFKDARTLLDNENSGISRENKTATLESDMKATDRVKSTLSESEQFKQKMYDEYMSKVAERLERRQQKRIKLSQTNEIQEPEEGKFKGIHNEFINKVKERMGRWGRKDSADSQDDTDPVEQEFENLFEEELYTKDAIKEGLNSKRNGIQFLLDPTSDFARLPKHLQEFLLVEDGSFDENEGSAMISPSFKATAPRPGIWSPVQTTTTEQKTEVKEESEERKKLEDEPIPPVWTPRSAQASPVLERREFRPVNFESPTLPRKKYIQEERSESVPPPWQQPGGDKLIELAKTPSSPALSLPKAPNPTVTLLQKAREGHIPRGAHYLNYNMCESVNHDGSFTLQNDKAYALRDDLDRPKKIELAPKKIIGIGPTTKEGIPLVLRSEVTDENKEKWYKRMYDSLHKAGKDEDYVTVKYRTSPSRKGLSNYPTVSSSGYQSEPESIIYDSNRYNKYSTLDRRRSDKNKDNDYISITLPRSRASTPRYGSEPYRNQPGRIEDYEPGHSSISELEARQWWDEVLEIFDRWLEHNPDGHGPDSRKLLTDAIQRKRQEERGQPIHKTQSPKSFMTYALKDSAFLSDPQHVFKRREDEVQSQLSPQEQKEAYRVIQKGGEVPLCGLRKPAPERPKDDRNAQIEYFPLSPTLTRIRVHKQNITPLGQFPFLQFPTTYQQNSLNYPNLPFGVCNSFSQVQIFPPYSTPGYEIENKVVRDTVRQGDQCDKNLPGKNRKFSVQLQNISEPKDYVQIVPKPRSQPKKCPIYANVPVRPDPIKEEISPRSLSPKRPSPESRDSEKKRTDLGKKPAVTRERNSPECKARASVSDVSKSETKTFSDLKRTAPSIVSKSLFAKRPKEIGGKSQKILSSVKKTVFLEKTRAHDKTAVKAVKSGVGKENPVKSQATEKKESKLSKKFSLSESLRREKNLTGKRLKTENNKKNAKKEEEIHHSEEERSDYLTRSVESQLESTYLDSPEESKTEEDAMNPVYDFSKPKPCYKHKVETNVTEAFRSRSFSPEVRRKIPKPVETVPPVESVKRKPPKNSSTLRMWSKTMVTYPYHRSRLDAFDSNVKFLREKLRRKLDRDERENENQFDEDVETVRTIKKDKDGSMSIKTNRYVNIGRPVSTSLTSPLRYTYNEHGRRVLSEPRDASLAAKTRKYCVPSTAGKLAEDDKKKTTGKEKADTVVRSSTTYSVRRPASLEDKRKSVKVTVAVSSKGKEVLRKSTSMPTAVRKCVAKDSLSPCPSISSYQSGLSGRSPSERGSTISSQGPSPQNRFFSPTSSIGRISSPSRSASPASVVAPIRPKAVTPPITLTFSGSKTKKASSRKPKEVTKSPGEKVQAQLSKIGTTKTEAKRKVKKLEKNENERKPKKNGVGKVPTRKREAEKTSDTSKNEVTEHTSLVRTDSFFQNLFLRDQQNKKSFSKLDRTSSVLERARRYQIISEVPKEHKGEPSISLITYYLTQKRPVSLSRFKCLDRELSSSRSPSPCLSRSPSFHMKLRHFDSLSQFGDDDLGSGQLSPNVKGRSFSEPPLLRSQTNSPEERIPIKPASRLSVSETSSLRTSPNSSRSPSCRRIQSFKPGISVVDFKRRSPRARSAGEAEESKAKTHMTNSLAQSTSSLNLSNFSDHAEYQAYVVELMHSKEKCQRFRDLHKFYSSLERMGELERAMSVSDLRPRLKNEEIIDFDRWKQLRAKERAEAELKSLVGKLLKVQKEKDLMFRTTDVEAVRWKGDRGLRLKERSVEDLKEQFNKASEEVADVDNFKKCLDAGKDVYKPFWRGNSIMNLASNLNATTASYRGRPVTYEELQRIKAAEERLAKKFGLKSFSNRAWSSLSAEQVDCLKNQLSEIFSQELRKKGTEGEDIERYEITVPEDSVKTPGEKELFVRCSSALSKNQVFSGSKEDTRDSKKSGSISALPSWKSEGDKNILLELPWKEEVDRGKSRPMTENEKKRLSMTLSKEVLEKLKAPVKTHLLPRETLGAMVVASNALRIPSEPPQEMFSPRTCYSLETSEDGKSKNDFLLVLTPTEKGKDLERVVEEWANGTSDNKPSRTTSITELESASASSETSVKTVIRNPVDVLKRVEYYEELQQNAEESMTVDSFGKVIDNDRVKTMDRSRGGLVPSHSLENMKEYFGEQQRYALAPDTRVSNEEEKMRSDDFHSLRKIFEEEKHNRYRYSPGGYRSSNESVFSFRSRSVSPDPTKYYRAYLRMVKCGAVRKLRNKFESWEDLLTLSSDKDPWLPPKRYTSDPELTRDLLRRYGTDPTKVTIRGQEVGDVRWLRTKYEKDVGNPRRRLRSPVARSPFTATDRLMPRINVISKTAELQMSRLRSPEGTQSRYLPASPEPYRSLSEYTRDHGGYYYTGEVEKLRRKFEKLHAAERLSILGQMYTSTPDVNELRDIAPYLGCSWAAHRHPELSKTSSTPDLRFRRPDASKKVEIKPRPHSSSPVRPKQPLSILKTPPHRDIFANQKFDPSIHRPLYRYQPEDDQRPKRGSTDSPHWRQWNKPSVKFKEPVDFFPETKPRDTSPDSPRKYVESEVTIHYKSPVRSETKALLSEDELARRQAESMKRIYKEERRRKYLQELQDMNSRRHTDNFIPSQKSPIPLNRYDDFPDEPLAKSRDHSTEPVLVARGLYDFVGRRPRELAFRRGDIIFIIRQLDKNWCEGELNGAVGLFPLSYVEIIPYNEYNPKFGRARAKYDFVPQTSLELSARKGEMITLVRKIDENWFEGRVGDRTGIIPASYCQVLSLPQVRIPSRSERATSSKPVASPAAHSLIHNGNAVSSKHYYTPFYGGRSSPGRSTTSPAVREAHAAIDQLIDEALFHLEDDLDRRRTPKPLNLRVNPRPEPALYQVLFNHVPNNDDELELIQGETVLVLEKCGDGWYIGSKTSGGKLGIFPGTHVRRIAPEFV